MCSFWRGKGGERNDVTLFAIFSGKIQKKTQTGAHGWHQKYHPRHEQRDREGGEVEGYSSRERMREERRVMGSRAALWTSGFTHLAKNKYFCNLYIK